MGMRRPEVVLPYFRHNGRNENLCAGLNSNYKLLFGAPDPALQLLKSLLEYQQ